MMNKEQIFNQVKKIVEKCENFKRESQLKQKTDEEDMVQSAAYAEIRDCFDGWLKGEK